MEEKEASILALISSFSVIVTDPYRRPWSFLSSFRTCLFVPSQALTRRCLLELPGISLLPSSTTGPQSKLVSYSLV